MKITLNRLVTLSLIVFMAAYNATVMADENTVAMKSEVKAVELFWKKRQLEENIERAAQLLKMVSRFNIDESMLKEAFSNKRNQGKWTPVSEDEPGLVVKLIPEYDEIRISNVPLADDTSGKDVGEKRAVSIAAEYMQELKKNGLLNGLDYNVKQFQVGQHIIGEGSLDGKTKRQRTTEYRVTFRANIDNIELANAGVRLAIHRTGKLSGIRLGGVTANTEQAKTLVRTVSDEQIQEQFKRSIPKGLKPDVAWDRVMYAMPDGAREALVEPVKIYSYSLVGDSGDGQEVVSRRKTLGFSITNADAEVIDFLPAAKRHTEVKLSRDPKADAKRHQTILEQHKH